METTNDNFEQLKAGLFQSIRDARTTHKEKGMCTVSTTNEYWPGRVTVMEPTSGSATVSVNVSLLSSCGTKMTAAELRQHAAHCIAAAEAIEEAAPVAQAASASQAAKEVA